MISRKKSEADFVDQPWLQGIVGILQQPVVMLDQFHRVVAASTAFHHLISVAPRETIGRPLPDLLDAPDLHDFLDALQPGSTRASRYRLELGTSQAGRRTLALNARRISARPSGEMIVVAVEETVPEGQAMDTPPVPGEQPEQRMLPSIAAMDHDLRQPLQTLSLLQGVLTAKAKDSEIQSLAGRLEEGIEALTGMLNAVAAVNQLASNTITPVIHSFPIGLILNRLRKELAYHAGSRGLEYRVVSSDLAVRSDSQLLGQVLRALLLEAMKLVTRGTVLFGCRRNGSRLVVQIWVKGTGVPIERQQLILNEFHKGSEPADSGGLVDRLVRPLSDRLNLAVKARSRPGSGLVFSAELPLDPHAAQHGARRQRLSSKGTVLVAADDPGVKNALVLLLREMGHEVVTTTSDDGFASLIKSRTGSVRPEVLIVDSKQANEHGRRVVSSLRWMFGAETPAIILGEGTAKGLEPDAVGEPYVYLRKPVRSSELTAQIDRFLALVRHHAAGSVRPARDALRQTIFVVDDDNVLRDAARDVFGHWGQEAELFSSSESFLAAYDRDRRGCLVIDHKLPGMTGVELLERLKTEGSTLPSIMITGHGDTSTAVRALKAGAIDYIEKPISYEALLGAVEHALEIDRGSAEALVRRRQLAARIAELTPRERQVMDLVVAGRSSKKIAQILKISQRTVENHRAAIMKRANATSLSDLIRIVMQLQLSADR